MKWISFTDIDGDFYLCKFDDLEGVANIENERTNQQEYYLYFSGYNEYDEYQVNEDVYKNILEVLKGETINLNRSNYSF